MNAIELEYHCFGPWILEVTDENPLPPIFVPYYKESNDYLMLIKVPSNIERTHAKPGMDLYNYVIGMYDNYVYILERDGRTVNELKFAYGEIEGIESLTDLLLGRLTIYMKDRILKIHYNSVSDNIITNLIKIIRDKYTQKIYKKMPIENNQSKGIERIYKNLLDSMKSCGDIMNISALQPSIKVRATNLSFFKKILNAVKQPKLLSAIHLSNDKELLILNRGKSFRYRSDTIHSYNLTYIPIEKIQSIELIKDEAYYGLEKIYININNYAFTFHLDENNKGLQKHYENLRNIV